METTGSTKSPFENFYGEKKEIIGSFSEFVANTYVTEREKIKIQMTEKTHKAIMVG